LYSIDGFKLNSRILILRYRIAVQPDGNPGNKDLVTGKWGKNHLPKDGTFAFCLV
jgi:hypothetical protein